MSSDRAALLQRLREGTFDLLVIGGGITGAGIARDAALRGLKVALVEKADLAWGTSSASSKLIHGGLRYLEQLELGLVREGVRERTLLMRNARHLARPLPFLFPVYQTSRVSMLELRIGMWAYDILSGFSNYRRHRILPRPKVKRAEPMLGDQGLRGAALYYDCLTNDARLTVETAVDAERHGAVVATWAEAVGFTEDGAGKTTGVLVRDRLDPASLTGEGAPGEPIAVQARVTAVAAGPWTDQLLEERTGQRLLRPTKGSHVVLDRARLPVQNALVAVHPRDGRVMFAIPWGERTVLGTTDTDEQDPPDAVQATAEDVDYLLEAANHYFPTLHATPADVISTWSGLRPLMGAPAGLDPSDVSREHAIVNLDPGLVAIAGGKLTTYRSMAEEMVDRVIRKLGFKVKSEPCRTKDTPLPGSADPDALHDLDAFAAGLAQEHALDEDVARHLAHHYGLRAGDVLAAGQAAGVRPGRIVPDLPYLVDEVVFACREEHARRLDDVLRRRTLVFLTDRDQGLGVAEDVARVMAQELGWDDERVDIEVARYRELVAASRSWQGTSAAQATA